MSEATWTSDDGRIRLFHARMEDVLPTLDRAGIGMVLTDPPYGIGHRCNFSERGRGNMAPCNDYPDVEGDNKPFDPAAILVLDLPTVLWGGNHFASRLPDSAGWLVWDKLRPDDLDQATCELAWTNCVKGVRRFAHLWHGMMRASEHGENYHPTQKPVALMEWVLSLPWIPDGLCFDPYMGSAPVALACIREGKEREYIGCETNAGHFATAVSRIEKELTRHPLLDPQPGMTQGSLL